MEKKLNVIIPMPIIMPILSGGGNFHGTLAEVGWMLLAIFAFVMWFGFWLWWFMEGPYEGEDWAMWSSLFMMFGFPLLLGGIGLILLG